ncbi:MAG TPA: LPS assembly protein LptD [Thermoanaerobaculia bacterium]
MRGYRLTPPALLLSLCLAPPVGAQTAAAPQQQQPAPSAVPPAVVPTEPRGPITPVAPPIPPGAAPPGGAPQTPPAAPPAVPPGPPGAGPGRLDFQLKFTGGKGGGAAGSAANLEYKREDYAVLSGEVRLKYQDLDLKADEAEIDLTTRNVVALGNVILDQGPRRLSGDSLTFNLDTKTGTIHHATGQVAPDYYFKGEEVDKTGDNTYVIKNGVFTSCSQPVPDWSFRVRRAEIEVEGYAHAHNTSMLVKQLPVLYLPYLLWPVRTERSSGLLVPNIGYSQRRGAELGLAYFQTLGRSYDTTFHLDAYSSSFLGLGDEFRYAPTQGTKGNFLGYLVRDPDLGKWRWKVQLNHDTEDLPWGMRGVVQYQNYSDFNFFRDFERDFNTNTLRFIDSRAFVTGNWGPHLLNLLLDSREVFLNQQNDTLTQRKLPELKYSLRSTQIARSPFYLELDSSVDYLSIDRPGSGQPGTYTGRYGRFDLFPQVTLPVRTFPWLNLSVSGGERLTWYGNTLNADQSAFSGNSLTRTFPFASAQIVGPSFSRIFNWKLGDLGKFKHIIEPRFTYTYQGDVSKNIAEVPVFDEVDAQSASNAGRIALDNRLLGKPDTETGVAREVLLFEVARNYSLDKTQPLQRSQDGTVVTTAGPLDALLRFNATEKIGFTATASYNTLFKGLASTSFTGNYGFGLSNYVGATWFTNYLPQTKETVNNQVRLNGALAIPAWHLRFEAQISYDIQQKLMQNDQIAVDFTSQCYAWRLEFRDFRTGTGTLAGQVANDREIRFSLSLKNVGTFLDLNSRSSTVQP